MPMNRAKENFLYQICDLDCKTVVTTLDTKIKDMLVVEQSVPYNLTGGDT